MTTSTSLTVNHMDIFPTRVWVCDLAAVSGHVPAWTQAVLHWRERSPDAAGRSNRMGWNSELTLFDNPLFAPLADAVRSLFDFIFAEMGPPTYPYKLQAWANVHDHGGYNAIHNHAGALLSACYYLQVPEGSGTLSLRDPRQGALLSHWNGSLRPNSGGEIKVVPQAGQLVIFPNWLDHATETHTGDTPRISIPINASLVI